MCYIEVRSDGQVSQGAGPDAYERARAGKSRLFAVWPGQWSSDLFVVDDLDEYARAAGIVHDSDRTGLQEHTHEIDWSNDSGTENPRASYVSVRVTLRCGCTIKNIRVFAAQMRTQLGWDVAVSSGWGSSWSATEGHSYSVRVRRRSLGPAH